MFGGKGLRGNIFLFCFCVLFEEEGVEVFSFLCFARLFDVWGERGLEEFFLFLLVCLFVIFRG